MYKKLIVTLAFPLMAVFFLASCSSAPQVTRVDSTTVTDISGYWNDTDVRLVCNALIKDCVSSARVQQAIARSGKKLPKVIVVPFRNESSEHINTSIISDTMEVAIFNSGVLDFVAGGASREALRDERQQQQVNAGEATASRLGAEIGADFMLTGSVKAIVDQAGNKSSRTYFVTAELSSIEDTSRLWLGQNSEIKKTITRPVAKF
jgi:PBP1b-binding outer membrane lipoprotein LpoB